MKLYLDNLKFKPRFACFILLIVFISHANELETAVKHDNTRVSVYLHPVSFLGLSQGMAAIYSTLEVPFSLSSSLIIRPSLWNFNSLNNDFRLGSDFGYRRYLTGKGEGLYLQGQMGAFYYKQDDPCDGGDSCGGLLSFFSEELLWIDAMVYIGHSLKFSHVSLFADAGIGAALGIGTKYGKVELSPVLDFNIGIGIPFGSGKPVIAQDEPPPKRDVNAQEELVPKHDNTRVSVYLHPASLILGIGEMGDVIFPLIYSTIEIPFNLKYSLIIRPSLVREPYDNSKYEGYSQHQDIRAGSDIGLRAYTDNKGEEFYWQMQTGVFYYDGHRLFPQVSAYNSIWWDIMAYSGYSKKFSNVFIFADIGIGLGSVFVLECERDSKCIKLIPNIDANLGIGIPF